MPGNFRVIHLASHMGILSPRQRNFSCASLLVGGVLWRQAHSRSSNSFILDFIPLLGSRLSGVG